MESGYEAVADVGELLPGQMKRVTVKGRRLLIVNDADRFFALDEMCSHEEYSLYYGCIKDGKIKCSLHGSYFDLKTGQPTVEPADEPICTYALTVADGKIWVDPTGNN